MQAEVRLPNTTLVDRVEDEVLEAFLSAADVWIIPYHENVAGVSVPSRFYNLLAIGRPAQACTEKVRISRATAAGARNGPSLPMSRCLRRREAGS